MYYDIYDLLDVRGLMDKTFGFSISDEIMSAIKREVTRLVKEKSDDIEAEYINEIESVEEERDKAEREAEEWYGKYREVSKKLEELEEQREQSEEGYITF